MSIKDYEIRCFYLNDVWNPWLDIHFKKRDNKVYALQRTGGNNMYVGDTRDPKTNGFLPLKMDGWKMTCPFWVSAYSQGQTVSFREGKNPFLDAILLKGAAIGEKARDIDQD